MDTQLTRNWMQLFHEKIQQEKDTLSQLDTPIGDGDHGGNMARGMAAVMEELDKKEMHSPEEVLKTVSMQLLSKVGGASGPLYGSAFLGMAKAVTDEEHTLSQILGTGLEMIQKRGKAEPGEKTMVDVWTAVIKAVESDSLSHDVIDQSVTATKDLLATKGRASYVGERSLGHIDPGSYSSGLLFHALLEAGDL